MASYEIFVSPTNGSGPPLNVSNNPGDDWSPEWSPDGSRIAFINGAPGAFFNPGRLKVVNVDGSGQLTLTPADNVWEPSWSPDGTRIAYSAADGQLYVANTDGSGRVPVANGGRSTWTGR